LLKNCAVDFVEICNVCTRKVIIKAAKRIFNSDNICCSYYDFYFGVTFLEHTVDASCDLPPSLAALAFSLIISLYVQFYTCHDVGLTLTTMTKADCEYIRLHRRHLILHGTIAVIWRRHYDATPAQRRHRGSAREPRNDNFSAMSHLRL